MDAQNPQANTFTKASVVTGVSLILGICFNYFFYDKIPGIAFPLYIALVVLGLFVVLAYFKRQADRQIMWLLIPLGFFSLMVFVRSSGLLTFLNIVASLLLLLLIAKISFAEKIKNFMVIDYIKIFFLPFKFLRPLFQTLSGLFTTRTINSEQKVLLQVVKGIVMAVPVLLIFLTLFSSADLIFQKYLSNIFRFEIEPETVFRSILVLVATLIFTGAYSYIVTRSQGAQPQADSNNTTRAIGSIETSILLVSVSALFFVFILVQLTYLFGGESTISSQGFTYAEYARKGFFELIAVAVISFLLLWGTEKYTAKKDGEHNLLFKVLSSTLIVEVILIMGSAFKRLLLYEEAYGFTTQRLYSHVFIIFLAVIFCLLLYKMYKDRRESMFSFRIFISLIVFLALMNVLNPDTFIARRNIDRFVASGKLDTYYLSQLSDDALTTSITILDSTADEDTQKSFARELYWRTWKMNTTEASFFSQWQSLNISRLRTKEILQSRMSELEQYKDYERQEIDPIVTIVH